ncbi:MAG TPA: SIMPL domain-containing protein [Vicinamibacterales bacterium]
MTPVVVTSGSAVISKAPDVAYVSVAVETRAKTPREAQRQNADLMNAVVKRLGELSVPADARRTSSLNLDQEFDTTNGRRVPRDFAARHSLEIRVDDVSKAGEIADAAVQAGATSIEGIRFDLKDRAVVEREAVRLAVADARARAEAAAAGAGRTLDRILKIEDGEPTPAPRPMMAMRMGAGAATVVEPRAIEIRAAVTLTVSMK